MLFKWELIEKIVAGQKTQTRRPANLEKEFINRDNALSVYVNKRLKWQVGRDYAVQYGRGLPTVVWSPDSGKALPIDLYWAKQSNTSLAPEGNFIPLRIKLTDIRYEDVRNISHGDSLAEGFKNRSKLAFLHTWASFYDKPIADKIMKTFYTPEEPNKCPHYLLERPDKLYLAWALNFEVVLP